MDIESAPRNEPLMLILRERGEVVCGFGSIEKLTHGERLSFGYVSGSGFGDSVGVVTTSGREVKSVVGWAAYPTQEPAPDLSELEIADRRVLRLEEALVRIRDTAEIAAEYGHFDMLVSTLQSLSEDAQQALKVTE